MPGAVELGGEPRGRAHHLLVHVARADTGEQRIAGLPDLCLGGGAPEGAHLIVHPVGGLTQRQLAQRDEIALAEEVLDRALGLLRQIDLAFFEAHQQVVGRKIDQHYLVRSREHVIGHGLGHADAGDAADDVVQALQVLHVDRGEHVDTGCEQLVDILPALGMAARRRVGVRQLIYQEHGRGAFERRVQVELLQLAPAIVDLLAPQDLQALQQCRGFAAAVRLDHADHHVQSFAPQPPRLEQHGVSLPHAGRGTEEDPQFATARFGFLRLSGGQQRIGVGSAIVLRHQLG